MQVSNQMHFSMGLSNHYPGSQGEVTWTPEDRGFYKEMSSIVHFHVLFRLLLGYVL